VEGVARGGQGKPQEVIAMVRMHAAAGQRAEFLDNPSSAAQERPARHHLMDNDARHELTIKRQAVTKVTHFPMKTTPTSAYEISPRLPSPIAMSLCSKPAGAPRCLK